MNIIVLGAGYVGLVTASCFAELGNSVVCIDLNQERVAALQQGILPIYEPGLESIVTSNIAAGRLQFTDTFYQATFIPHFIFIAVGTPSDNQGGADMQYVLAAATQIGKQLQEYCVIVDKSTVPVGVAGQVSQLIQAELNKRQLPIAFDVVSNPEFLREGAAIDDFMNPDRLIIGLTSLRAKNLMLELYAPIMRHTEKIYFMDVKDAEMTKYVANAMLATKISFMNEMAILCEKMGVDIELVRQGIGSDSRIGPAFINPGCGYGGSCFPKDVKALIKMSEEKGLDSWILRAVEARNEQQKRVLPHKVTQILGEDLSGCIIGIWGLSFKPGTDDMREASSLVLIRELIAHKATIMAYDPVAMSSAERCVPEEWIKSGQLSFFEQQYDVLNNADVLVLVTEWKQFSSPNIQLMKTAMRRPIIIDGRNQFDVNVFLEAGFQYYGIGRGQVPMELVSLPTSECISA